MVRNGYFAAVLTEKAQRKLAAAAKHPQVYCHHVTLAYRPTEEQYEKYAPLLGTTVFVDIEEMREDEKGQAASVRLAIPCENIHPHVTISCADGIPAVYSNALLKAPGKKAVPCRQCVKAVVCFYPLWETGRRPSK